MHAEKTEIVEHILHPGSIVKQNGDQTQQVSGFYSNPSLNSPEAQVMLLYFESMRRQNLLEKTMLGKA